MYGLDFLLWVLVGTVAYILGGSGLLVHMPRSVWENERWLAVFVLWPGVLIMAGLKAFTDWIAEMYVRVVYFASNETPPDPLIKKTLSASERGEIKALHENLKRVEQARAFHLKELGTLDEERRETVGRLRDLGVCGYRDDDHS